MEPYTKAVKREMKKHITARQFWSYLIGFGDLLVEGEEKGKKKEKITEIVSLTT